MWRCTPVSPASLTRQDRQATAALDLIDRDFTASPLSLRWTADITYVPTGEGRLYLAVVLDLFSRRIVGWAMADHMRTELIIDALAAATARRPRPDPVRCSDARKRMPSMTSMTASTRRCSSTFSITVEFRNSTSWPSASCQNNFRSVTRDLRNHYKRSNRNRPTDIPVDTCA
ncbi:DDE-type integrase/transposase/recombinase [Streptomyces sp. 8ZJF_21]|uniref:DDE-type integrase/transposase/recombinase n=1 Tax=Streptomyces sp. 8ZJF_21 TaxID=2903141 RepID=UPI001E4872AB|nr:DDE-type integrase/transposase/recombinase [Streptomyces sp. 8ZJF_21]MCD9589675.1 DDE-type integrase/transposase/recombinase [Streptomyces sp. 8ZJF_21]